MYFLTHGWTFKGGVWVRYSSPRLGWKPDGTMIVGYHEVGKVESVYELKRIIKKFKVKL